MSKISWLAVKRVYLCALGFIMCLLAACQLMETIEPIDISQAELSRDHVLTQTEDKHAKEDNDDQDVETQTEKSLPQEPRKEEEPPTMRLMVVGDTMMAGNMGKVMDEKGIDYPLSQFMTILKQGDFLLANLETAVGTSGQLVEKTYAFQTDPTKLELFNPLKGKIIFSLANNHGMDAPLLETMYHLDQLGYSYIGVGENIEQAFYPFVGEINGISFAVIGASRVIPTTEWVADTDTPGMASAYTDEPLLSTVNNWASQVDIVIVYLHWGEERQDLPNQVQLELEKKLVNAGANLIIGAHPHVLQEIKWLSPNQLTAFSLGNFVFTTSTTESANYTLVLDIQFTAEEITALKIWPGKIDFGLIRYLDENDPERKLVIQRLQQLSPTIEIEADGTVKRRE